MSEKILLTARFDKVNPLSIDDYLSFNGYSALQKAVKMNREDIINEIKESRLTGRGGAAFPVHIKMSSVAREKGDKILICNADEGEPGNFKDRYLMEKDPHQVLEGMIISAFAVGATKAYIYIRGEYRNSIDIMKHAIEEARLHGFLGKSILETNQSLDIEIRRGCGAYVCGEEFALIESIEGKAGRTRVKPPYPTQKGAFNLPTLINNVETFANLPHIINMSGKKYSEIGSKNATGTKLISLSGNVKNKGLYEVEYGTTIRYVVEVLGKGPKNNRKIKMVQLGGASGPIIPEELLDMEIDNESFHIFNSKMASGAVIVMDDSHDLFDVIYRNMTFFAHESCGKCAPCREGHTQIVRLVKKFVNREASMKDYNSLKSLAHVIHESTLCGLGQTSPTSILSTIEYFPDEYMRKVAYRKERGF